jgi:cyclophilin family peptidyl-prolyl cis-trans isomerase
MCVLLFLVGCGPSTYNLKYCQQLSPTQIVFKQSPDQLMHFIQLINITIVDGSGQDFWQFTTSQSSNDTTYFQIFNRFEVELEELASDKRFSLYMKNTLYNRVIRRNSGSVVEAIRAHHSNTALPASYYQVVEGYGADKKVGRYFVGGYVASDTIWTEKEAFKEFIVLLDKAIDGQLDTTQRKKMYITIETTKGDIELELFKSDAPKTAANFAGLAEEGYFNGVIFHRVSKGFVIQGGDSTGTGTGGKSIYGKEFEDELNPYKAGYKRGTVAMANRGPNTNTSQFFIVLRDVALPKKYTIFGKVSKGMEVVDSIAAVEIIPQMGPTDGKPKVDVVMKKVYVEK